MHPYKDLPSHSYWKSGVADHAWTDIDFKPTARFRLSGSERIATAGSCFAQHVARHLPRLGLNHYVLESAPSILPAERVRELQYGVFSARYGNIYTARQLRQTIEFAFGLRDPVTMGEQTETGWIDLLRPGVQFEGFDSLHDLECDRLYHHSRVKKLFLEADCFIFTLGLTEAWQDAATGLIFPACPGTRAGTFDPSAHHFINFDVVEVWEDLNWCVNFIQEVNPAMKWIFTVSPVALAATATDQHVLIATAASKSTLRVAADLLCRVFPHCDYFPSYEIVSSAASFGQFLDGNLREISPRGVDLVMRIFKRSFVDASPPARDAAKTAHTVGQRLAAFSDVECEEAFNDPARI